jgi:antitoxin VapB
MDFDYTVEKKEINLKIERILNLLEQRSLDALLLRRISSFAWATCGAASYINTAASEGVASLLITPKTRYLITNNIEAPRFEKEENLAKQGWDFQISPWHSANDQLAKLTHGLKLGADGAFVGATDLSADLAWLRSQLTPEEGLRFRALSQLCAKGMKQAVDAVNPGMSEYQIAGLLSQAVESRGVQVIVNLIATDERIFSFRHPLPTKKTLQRYAMLVVCGRKWGLVCSLTRLIYFGSLPDEIHRKVEAVAQVDGTIIAATRPGSTMGEVFHQAQEAYTVVGFPDEWQHHHQGGSAGYEPREITATPGSTQPVQVGQVYAWNPSIRGVKSEDTILVGEQANEILTEMTDWPVIEIKVGNKSLKRPTILEKDKQS